MVLLTISLLFPIFITIIAHFWEGSGLDSARFNFMMRAPFEPLPFEIELTES
jgi:hypothetical protein